MVSSSSEARFTAPGCQVRGNRCHWRFWNVRTHLRVTAVTISLWPLSLIVRGAQQYYYIAVWRATGDISFRLYKRLTILCFTHLNPCYTWPDESSTQFCFCFPNFKVKVPGITEIVRFLLKCTRIRVRWRWNKTHTHSTFLIDSRFSLYASCLQGSEAWFEPSGLNGFGQCK